VVSLVASGRLRPEAIISHRLTLAQAAEGYAALAAAEATKVLLTPGG
jgi:threonine dehydrogenase-like Zn-dependent dehydrogenase